MRVCKHGCDVLYSHTSENYFMKAMEHFFTVYIASSKHSGLGEFSKVIQTRDVVEALHNCLEFYQPSSCLDEAM